MSDKYGYSSNGEEFYGDFDSPEAAADEGINEEGGSCVVGMFSAPCTPEGCIDAGLILEQVACQDDYCVGDWGSDWPESNKEQEQELTESLRAVFAAWLDKHNLRPTFRLVCASTMRRFSLVDGVITDMGPNH